MTFLTKALIATALLLAASPGLAFESNIGGFTYGQTNVYGANGQYQGRAAPGAGGGYNYFGPDGQYQGRAAPGVGGGFNYFGTDGHYEGRSGD